MTKPVFFLMGLIFSLQTFSQNDLSKTATVEKVLNVPVFIYAYPSVDFEEVETMSATMSAIADALGEESSVSSKIKEIVNKAKRKAKRGDVGPFDAIIINPDDYSGILIKFTDEISLHSEVKKISNVPVFLFSYPEQSFEEVDQYSATFSALLGGSSLSRRTKEIVTKAKKREKKGKVEPFDAIIISPDDFTGILIKYN